MNKTKRKQNVGGRGGGIKKRKERTGRRKRNEEKRKDRVAEETANSKLTNCKQQTTDN